MQKRNSQGFTLIEVLIASTILFLFLAMAAQAFSQSAQTSIKAERAAKVAALVPLLVENIRGDIHADKSPSDKHGQGAMLDMTYQWRASLLERKAPVERFDPSEMEFKTYQDRFNLWKVDVMIVAGSYQRNWQYEEISWFK
jgi:prepilin-type N-terminal cleavage/methylation domain-containing protein